MSDNKTSWLVCQQTHYDAVKYQSIEGTLKYPSYNQFLEMMIKFNIRDPLNFKKNLDSFKTIYINLDTGDWELIDMKTRDDWTYNELQSYNNRLKQREEQKEDNIDGYLERGKRFIFGRKKY